MSLESCSVCLDDKPNLPIRLDCNHIFCYLCIKSVKISTSNGLCPLCRTPISNDILENMTFDDCINKNILNNNDDKIVWVYHGRDFGWWLFDPNSSDQIENLYNKFLINKKTYEIIIGSMKFTLDFDNMYQINNNGIKRKILRADQNDLKNIMIKGVAGLSYKKN